LQRYNNFGKYRYTFVSLTCFLTILWHFDIKFYVKDGLRKANKKRGQTISVQSQRSQKKVNQLSDSRQSIPVEQDNLFRMDRQYLWDKKISNLKSQLFYCNLQICG